MTIKKADFAVHVNKTFGLPMATAERVVGIIFGEIAESLRRGESVKIKNFGTFNMNEKGARPGRNPHTGQPVMISARRVPTFRASREFKDQVGRHAE
jgi:integration host factor subunit alpha